MKERNERTERKNAFDARTEQYRNLGYDRFAATSFVVGAGGKLAGPALDVGTGKGLTAMALARQGLDVVSVDTDADEQALASLLAAEAGLERRIQFLCGNASALPYADGHFRCAALMDVLHHLEDPEPVLEETARVLTPFGVLILADFSPEGFELVARVHREDGREHAVSGATLESAETFLSRSGFEPTVRRAGHKHEVTVFVKKAGDK